MTDYIVTLVRAFSGLNKGFNCLTNGSLTPQKPVEDMLSTLPEEIWHNKDCTFLLPCEDYGWMLFGIYSKYMKGLEDVIPNVEERIKNIYSRITIIPKTLNVKKDIYAKNILTKWIDKFKLNDYIKLLDVDFLSWETDMKFDVIIGNPPYQERTDGNLNGAQAKPIYHLFIMKAIEMSSKYVSMITPSRWFSGGWGLNKFRDMMIKCNHICSIDDYQNASDVFSDVDIKGGVSYFLYDKNYNGMCKFTSHNKNEIESVTTRYLYEDNCDVIIRHDALKSIYNKVCIKISKSFIDIVSSLDPFGLNTNDYGSSTKNSPTDVDYFERNKFTYIERSRIVKNENNISKWKLFVPKNAENGILPSKVIGNITEGKPGTACSGTYMMVGPFNSEEEMKNAKSYMCTKFFRALVSIYKNTQCATKRIYKNVPMQDFSKPWTDKELYEKYMLDEEEIKFIEKNIKKMS